jgi:lipoate-protein ligase A
MDLWHLLESPAAAAPWNMAVDEALLRTASQRRGALLRVYGWSQPAVSIGYFQKFPAELAGQYAVVRRPTGGGLVYHTADTTYTVVAPTGHPLHGMATHDAYCAIHRAVMAALHLKAAISLLPSATPRGRYECFQNPVAGDVVAAGAKLAGGAQRRSRTGLLHQGSIAARVATDRLVAGFRQEFGVEFEPYTLTGQEHALAESFASGKYTGDAWNKRL